MSRNKDGRMNSEQIMNNKDKNERNGMNSEENI